MRTTRPAEAAVNREGLTWEQWYGAATAFVQDPARVRRRGLRGGWQRGEDPTDWAAALSRELSPREART